MTEEQKQLLRILHRAYTFDMAYGLLDETQRDRAFTKAMSVIGGFCDECSGDGKTWSAKVCACGAAEKE